MEESDAFIKRCGLFFTRMHCLCYSSHLFFCQLHSSFLRFESEKLNTGQQMVFERPPHKKRDKVGGSVVRRALKNRKKKFQRDIGRMRTFRSGGTVEPSRPMSSEKGRRQPECKLNPPHSCKYCLSH